MTFTPRFTKPTVTKDGVIEVTLPNEELESIINELSNNKRLIILMKEYIKLARQPEIEISEEYEIKLRQEIFPFFDEKMHNKGKYRMFSPDVSEEMFQRIEAGTLEVQS